MNPKGFGYFIASNGGGGANAGPTLTELIDFSAIPAVLPVGALIPGPQITVPRSVVPTTPASVVWASTGYIDFVADCGADPTGVADCGPALVLAGNLLTALAANPKLAATAARLFVPPGLYHVATPGGVWNFGAGHVSSVEVI